MWLAEEVDVWLEERGLTRLLAEHLEQRIEKLNGESRAEAVIRLAKIYAVLLAETEDRAQRISLEETWSPTVVRSKWICSR